MEKPSTPALFERLFNEDFRLVSYNFKDGRMQGLDVEIRHGNKPYHMTIESWPLHMERVAAEEPGTELEETAYVLPEDEIFPSDVAAIKAASFEQLAPYLVEQE